MNLLIPEMPPKVPLQNILEQAMLACEKDPTWDLREQVDRIPKKPPRDHHPGVHPSDLEKNCRRLIVYALLGVKRQERPWEHTDKDLRTIQIFHHGDAIHLQWMTYFLQAMDIGLIEDVRCEVPVVEPVTGIVGTMDVVYRWSGHRYVSDIKSAGPTMYYGTKDLAEASSSLQTAKSAHRRQLTAYMVGEGLQRGQVVYADKALDDRTVLDVPFDAKVWKEDRRDIEVGREMIELDALPPTIDNWYVCSKCVFRDVCEEGALPSTLGERGES